MIIFTKWVVLCFNIATDVMDHKTLNRFMIVLLLQEMLDYYFFVIF